MPVEMERRLRTEAQQKFPGDEERQDRYVYGTLRKQGWRPGRVATAERTSGAMEPRQHHSPVTEWHHWYFGKLKLDKGVLPGGTDGR